MDMDDEIEEGPISDPASCMETVKKEAADAAEDLKDLAKDAFEEGKEAAEDFADAVKNQAAEAKDIVQDAAEEFDTDFPSLLKSETAALKEQAKQLTCCRRVMYMKMSVRFSTAWYSRQPRIWTALKMRLSIRASSSQEGMKTWS